MGLGRENLNLNVRSLKPSATVHIKAIVNHRREQGLPTYDFGLGESPFPVPEDMVRALQESAAAKSYLPVQGLPALREAIAGYLQRRGLTQFEAHQILVGPGTKELLFLLQVCFHGDLWVPTPCWVSYMPQSKIVGHSVRMVETSYENGWKLDAEALELELEQDEDHDRPRLLVLNAPGNPTGQVYEPAELEAIAEVARKYHLLVLSDEIYCGLQFDGAYQSISAYYPEGTIVLDGVSKWAGAGGWRLGAFAFPEQLAWLQAAMASVASETYTSVSAPIQHGSIPAFEEGNSVKQQVAWSRRILAAIARRVAAKLREVGCEVQDGAGAFYLFPRLPLPPGRTRDWTMSLLADTGVALLPGEFFGRSAREPTVRMSLVDFDGAAAMAWLRDRAESLNSDGPELEALVEEAVTIHCAHLLEGIDGLTAWLRELHEVSNPAPNVPA